MYKLQPTQDDNRLFFRMDNNEAERYGAIGYLRSDFGSSGREFWSTWFDCLPNLKTPEFRAEIDELINSLRDDGPEPPIVNRNSLAKHCGMVPGKDLGRHGDGYLVRTLNFSYYFRCLPLPSDYDVYCFAYDNRFLLHELAGQHALQ